MLRFTAAVLVTSGILLIADAAVTLAWQEPVSAVIGWRAQSALEDELADRQAELGVDGKLSERELRAAAKRTAERVKTGDALGRIELPSLERDYVVVEGTDEASLRKGPGHYPDTALPGEGRTVGIAGHRTTYLAPFRAIDKLEEGDEVTVTMPYAKLTYEVQKQEIVPPTQTSVVRDVGYDRLVLSACHPLYSAAERIIVFAKLAKAEPS